MMSRADYLRKMQQAGQAEAQMEGLKAQQAAATRLRDQNEYDPGAYNTGGIGALLGALGTTGQRMQAQGDIDSATAGMGDARSAAAQGGLTKAMREFDMDERTSARADENMALQKSMFDYRKKQDTDKAEIAADTKARNEVGDVKPYVSIGSEDGGEDAVLYLGHDSKGHYMAGQTGADKQYISKEQWDTYKPYESSAHGKGALLRPSPTGLVDDDYNTKSPTIPQMDKIASYRSSIVAFEDLIKAWKPEYGKQYGDLPGDTWNKFTALATKNQFTDFIGQHKFSEEKKEAMLWWAKLNYEFGNPERHAIFGAALPQGELQSWAQAFLLDPVQGSKMTADRLADLMHGAKRDHHVQMSDHWNSRSKPAERAWIQSLPKTFGKDVFDENTYGWEMRSFEELNPGGTEWTRDDKGYLVKRNLQGQYDQQGGTPPPEALPNPDQPTHMMKREEQAVQPPQTMLPQAREYLAPDGLPEEVNTEWVNPDPEVALKYNRITTVPEGQDKQSVADILARMREQGNDRMYLRFINELGIDGWRFAHEP